MFRTAARLVQVNVTVMDSRGQPVTDLNAGDFTIRESGKPREIALFGFEGGTSRAAPPRPLPPGVFSNQVQFIGGPPRNVTALILDMVNTSTRDNFFVRSQVLNYLKKSHTSDTRLAIYVLSGDGLKTIAEFTEDADLLRSRLDQMVVSLPPVIPFRQDRIRRTLDALDAVGRHLEGIPGRKSVVWISGGFSVLDVSEIMGMGPHVSIDGILEADVRNAAQSLAQRGVALYIVSASGLRGGARGDASARGVPPGSGTPLFNALRRASEISNGLRGTMGMMAAITGGKDLSDTNDMAVGLKNAFDDLKAGYTLGFYAADADDKWHPLEVRVRRRGLTVRSRQGWIAASEQRVAASTNTDAWRHAIEDPLGSSAILMSARCQPESNEAAVTLELILRIDANSVAFERDGDSFVSSLDVVTVDRTADGGLRPFTQRVTVEWDDKRLAVGRTQGIVYVRKWNPQADVTAIRVIVRDRHTGKYGTLDMPMSSVLAAGSN